MKATYNSIGQMISEKWYGDELETTLTAHYKYSYDGQGNIVRSIDICNAKEYNYIYEGDKLVRAKEYAITISDDIIVSKSLINKTIYKYKEDKLVSKHIGKNYTEHTVYYNTNDDDNAAIKFISSGKEITIRNKTDSLGRKEFDEIQYQTGYLNRKFTYYEGEFTNCHKGFQKVKSEPTTQLVSKITFSNGHTISYTYDEEERITCVNDSIDGLTEYTYDALGQLKTETKNGVKTKFEYDNYGNITAKGICDESDNIIENTKIEYGYSTGAWKDLLTSYYGQEIVYDSQGNPTTYLGHCLSWEKGRQLKSFDDIQYTYNANGIRTSKIVSNIQHSYHLEGSKILKESWGSNTLIPVYDSEDSICGIIYNRTPYYFQKNLQGDIIAITNSISQVVARYSYDAWGVPIIVEDTSGCKIANINPFLYRGYYYDHEIGMYYLQSRYYDPVVGRFVNADSVVICNQVGFSLKYNLFVYCVNEPLFKVDPFGCEVISGTLLALLGQACIVVAGLLLLYSIVSSPQFQQLWQNICITVQNNFYNRLKTNIALTIATISLLSSKAKSIAKSIADSFARVKTIPRYRSKKELHHIVAKKAANAKYARTIINSVGIGYNSPKNLILINTGLHRRLHTNEYYGFANSVVISAYNAAKGKKYKQRQSVIAALNSLRNMIMELDALSPF